MRKGEDLPRSARFAADQRRDRLLLLGRALVDREDAFTVAVAGDDSGASQVP